MRAYVIKITSKTKNGYLRAVRNNGFTTTDDIKRAKKYDANAPNILNYIMYDIDMISLFDLSAVCIYDIINSGIEIGHKAVLEETVWFQTTNKHIPYCVGSVISRNNKRYFLDNFGTEQLIKLYNIHIEQYRNGCLVCCKGNEIAMPNLMITPEYTKDGKTPELVAKFYARVKRYIFIERTKVKEFLGNI